MHPIERLRRMFHNPTPIRPGHYYTDVVTGERVFVHSVGRHVELERMDADRRPETTVPKETFRRALEHEFVTHEPRVCSECRTGNDVR